MSAYVNMNSAAKEAFPADRLLAVLLCIEKVRLTGSETSLIGLMSLLARFPILSNILLKLSSSESSKSRFFSKSLGGVAVLVVLAETVRSLGPVARWL